MKESTQTALRAAAVLGVAFGLCVTGLTAADAKNPIKDAMQKYHKAPKGTDPTCKKAGAGQASKEEIKGMLESKPQEVLLNRGDMVEITSGPFKGEKAKVVRIDNDKEELTVELVEVAVPIPVTLKLNTVKVLSSGSS